MTAIVGLADLALLQADAESLMLDTCTITRRDPANFDGPRLTVYSGKCRVRMVGRVTREEQEPEGPSSDAHRCRVDLPASTPAAPDGPQFNDSVHIDTSISPSMVGFDCYVRDVPTQTLSSALRLMCERTRR